MAIQGTREQLVKQKMFMTEVMNSNLELEGRPFVRISIYTLASRVYKIQRINNFISGQVAVSI